MDVGCLQLLVGAALEVGHWADLAKEGERLFFVLGVVPVAQ